MITVKIESRRDYELYIKKEISKLQISNKHKAIFRNIAMHCFDDGIKMNQHNLTVLVATND